ncbi:hypothetical protein [Christiangramia flava]|uniref:Uncharacterized protein n=1 Tax=Christiangramia flava JLT2011 TaxID=1229726 RepID=A0A1L7I2D2_9FLAO|nr:hypothetical protein [Christiangramia flava]APU67741.1 hypothetical protein GRFL_1017 [Christiangramia flava JLT2011]OSS40245.1 hypothetical protein C723_0553 [Christiangramia flava JLT2011]
MSIDPTQKLSHQKIVDGFPEKYRHTLVELLETKESTVDLLKLRVLELPNSERNAFMSIIENFVRDEIFKTYYKAKYKNPRSIINLKRNRSESHFDYVYRYLHEKPEIYSYLEDKEIDLLSYRSPAITEQIEDPYREFDIAEHFYPFEFPLTDSWINRKQNEFAVLPEILNNFSFSKTSLSLTHSLDPDNLEKYSFPKTLINRQLESVYSNSDRINIDQSLEDFLSSHTETFHYIQQCLSPDSFNALLFNSFNFKNNDTNLRFLNISLKSGVTLKLFRHYLFKLYEDLDIEKPKIGFIQFINFHYARKTLSKTLNVNKSLEDQKSILETHYNNTAKNTVSLITAELKKAQKKANIFDFQG